MRESCAAFGFRCCVQLVQQHCEGLGFIVRQHRSQVLVEGCFDLCFGGFHSFRLFRGIQQLTAANTFIVSSRINWEPYFEYILNCMMNGEDIALDWTGTIATGSVELSAINEQAAAAGTAEKLEEVKAALAAGTIKVFDTATFTVNGEALTSYLADVDDMGDFVGDTEVVIDGEFKESFFRAAPYFDLNIDGITLPEGM